MKSLNTLFQFQLTLPSFSPDQPFLLQLHCQLLPLPSVILSLSSSSCLVCSPSAGRRPCSISIRSSVAVMLADKPGLSGLLAGVLGLVVEVAGVLCCPVKVAGVLGLLVE